MHFVKKRVILIDKDELILRAIPACLAFRHYFTEFNFIWRMQRAWPVIPGIPPERGIMGAAENKWLRYLDDPARFAGLVNGWLMAGREEFHAPDVKMEDRRLDQIGEGGGGKSVRLSSRYRDLAVRIGNCRYRLIVGTELSTYVDYQAPARALDYDSLEYQRQIRKLAYRHRQDNDLSGDGRFSGLSKEDRLIPVLDLYLYTGTKKWDGPTCLHDMLQMEGLPEAIRGYVEDYRVHLLDVGHTPDDRLLQFPEELAAIFLFIKYQKSKRRLGEIVEHMPVFRHMSRAGFDLVNSQTNMPVLVRKRREEEETLDMCQAIREMIEEGKAEGKADMVISFLADLGDVPEELKARIAGEKDLAKLEKWGKKAARAGTIEQFQAEMGVFGH